jgi:cysteine desulfurase
MGYAFAHMRRAVESHVTLVADAWAHPSVIAPMRFATERGFAKMQTLDDFLQSADPSPTLVSLSQVNHETGDITDLKTTIAQIKKINPAAVVHVDGAQGFCKEAISLNGIDLYTMSAHKFHGATGVGGLFVKQGVRLVPLLHGGGQENQLRAGTENVTGIANMATAAEQFIQNRQSYHAHVTAIRDTIAALANVIPNTFLNHTLEKVSPYILNMSFLGIKGEVLVHALSAHGLYVSTGAACQSKKKIRTVLEEMGFSKERADSAIRFSFSCKNTIQDAENACEIIVRTVREFTHTKN